MTTPLTGAAGALLKLAIPAAATAAIAMKIVRTSMSPTLPFFSG
jgi:hypothetical protein